MGSMGSLFSIAVLSLALVVVVGWALLALMLRMRRYKSELDVAQTQLREAQDVARMGSWSRDFESGERFWSPEALRLFGLKDSSELSHYEKLVHPDDVESVVEVIAQAYDRGGKYECEHRIISPNAGDDGERYVRLSGQVFLDEGGKSPIRELGTIQDITDRKKAEHDVRRSELQLRSILDSAPYPILIFEPDSMKVLYANRNTYGLFELSEANGFSELRDMERFWVTQADRLLLSTVVEESSELRNHETLMKTSVGKLFWALLSASTMDFAGERALFVSLLDVTDKKIIQEELERIAKTDALTGIFNRRSFFEASAKELKRAVRYSSPLTVIMLDIDHFKQVNDNYGHAFGDTVIKSFTEACNKCLREEDIFGRIGGEEFAILLVASELENSMVVAERIRDTWANTALECDGVSVSFTVSSGVSSLLNPRESIEMVLERADKALYVAKKQGRNCVRAHEQAAQAS